VQHYPQQENVQKKEKSLQKLNRRTLLLAAGVCRQSDSEMAGPVQVRQDASRARASVQSATFDALERQEQCQTDTKGEGSVRLANERIAKWP